MNEPNISSRPFGADDLRRRWFLVFTKPANEKVACTNLERQGYSVYHPRLVQRSVSGGRKVQRIAPLFPRYLFVRVDPTSQSLTPIHSTTGVVSIVRFGVQPAVVPDSIVESLIYRADPETGLHALRMRALESGAEVKVIGGVFEGLDGVFERAAGDDRVVVLLNLLGRDTRVRLPLELISPSVAA